MEAPSAGVWTVPAVVSADEMGGASQAVLEGEPSAPPRRIFFAEALHQTRPTGCCGCRCMRDPEMREENLNRNLASPLQGFQDQNETPWPTTTTDGVLIDTEPEIINFNSSANNLEGSTQLHADLSLGPCRNLLASHASKKCRGLECVKPEDRDRFHLREGNSVLVEKCNEVLRRFWCEQQSHGLTNLCYFISEVEKVCFDAMSMPCDQIYGFLDRGFSSIPHAWVRLGIKKQLVDITFYSEKSSLLPNHYWIPLKEYKTGLRPPTIIEQNDFKKANHWRYLYLCTLVPERRSFLRCMFKFMNDEMMVTTPDIFKEASSSCWNCDRRLGNAFVSCDTCESARFCDNRCRDTERTRDPSHREICDDYKKRVLQGSLKLVKPAVQSLEDLTRSK